MPVADTAFAGLPLSVKAGVLRYLVGKHVESPAEWKQQLRLLAVCSKWRTLALPLVYGNIFIACSGPDDDDNADEDSDELRDGDPSKAVFTTNIDLVVKMGQHRKARCLCLRMDYEMGLVPFVRKVQSLLRIVSRCWESVERVHVELISNADPRRAELSGEAIELASDLASVLPRVTRLYANADVEDDVCRLFAGTLVSAYAHQLAACSCYVKIEPNMPPFSEKLARMVVRVNEKSVPHAPCIRAGSLASLHFTDTADDSIWSMFVGPDGSSDAASTIEFTNLRHLHMIVDNDGDDEDTQDGKVVHQLAFPRLSLLKLNLSQPAARLLARSRLPSRLDKLEVMSFRAGAAALHNTHIGASEQIQLSALIGSDEAAAFWNMANFLFGTEGLGGYSQLLIANATNIPEPDQLAWANLTKLEIMPTVESSYLLRLIQRLPSTEELIVHNLAFTVAPASEPILAVAEPGAHPVAPLNTRIRILRLNYRQTAENGRHGLELIKRLLPRLPAVDEIFMPHFPREFYEFVAEFGFAYPHIAAFSPDDDVPA
ncbi:hypothetical protein IWQ56_000590 [Coemansia nantahalensis]|nr:hypothetical protein IWQ56_000590 [Coemansia nantahalensis]